MVSLETLVKDYNGHIINYHKKIAELEKTIEGLQEAVTDLNSRVIELEKARERQIQINTELLDHHKAKGAASEPKSFISWFRRK